jgi:hypothetical protein
MLFHIEATLDDETWLCVTPMQGGKALNQILRVAIVSEPEDVDRWVLYGAVRARHFRPLLLDVDKPSRRV